VLLRQCRQFLETHLAENVDDILDELQIDLPGPNQKNNSTTSEKYTNNNSSVLLKYQT
jgi:hypothetical protein